MELKKETRLDGEFEGFDGDKVFTFVGGEQWRQAVYKYKYRYKYRPKVKLWKDGSKYFLEVEGMNEMIQVRRL